MQKFKHTLTTFASLALLASFPACAAMKEIGLMITGGASYMLPTQNDLDYVDLHTAERVRTRTLEPVYSWGYYLGAGYAINNDYDVQGSWAQFDSNIEDETVSVGEVGGVVQYNTSNGTLLPLSVGNLLRASTINVLNTGILDLNVGQTHAINEGLRARYFAGVRYARVSDEVTNVYQDPAFAAAPFDHYESTFNGIGPEAGFELGIDFRDTPYDPIGLIAGLGVGLLVGDIDAKSDVYVTSQTLTKAETTFSIVPNLFAKLGIKWGLIEGGWQVSYFYDGVDQLQLNSSNTLTHNRSSVTITGAYLNMSAKL
jgi:hypothetical protein